MLWMMMLFVSLLMAASAAAKDCTGWNCACGDRLVANWNSGNLGTFTCPGSNGLRLGSNVTWTGTGTVIIGTGMSGSCGIKFEGSNSTVLGVSVQGWYDGVCNLSGPGNGWGGATVAQAPASYSNTHYGVHSTKSGFQVGPAIVRNNLDEGIHCSEGSCHVYASDVYSNATVQVYFLNNAGGSVRYSQIAYGTTGIHLKDASGHLIERNILYRSPIHVRQNSDGNHILFNQVDDTFIKLEGNATKPDHNYLNGNQITRNNTKIHYKNPGVNNLIAPQTFIGTGNDVTCELFAASGTNNFDASPGDSVINSGTCLTVF